MYDKALLLTQSKLKIAYPGDVAQIDAANNALEINPKNEDALGTLKQAPQKK